MYSRNFNSNSPERLPPDYNGTAYIEKESIQPPKAPAQQLTDLRSFTENDSANESFMSRRPMFPTETTNRSTHTPSRVRNENSSILHNLDLLNRKFTLEDILLAVLILMLIGGQNDNIDNTEIILILGFLFLVGLT